MALLTGMYANERPLGSIDLAPLLWRPFAEAGYRTLYAKNAAPSAVSKRRRTARRAQQGSRTISTDYHFRPMNLALANEPEAAERRREKQGASCVESSSATMLNWVWVYYCHYLLPAIV